MSMPPDTAAATPHPLDGLAVYDADGRPVALRDLWATRTAVLIFVRHFGCLFCRQQVTAFLPLRDAFARAGAELVVIGNGSVDDLRDFREEVPASLPVYTDPTRKAYCAMGMQRGAATVLSVSTFVRAALAFVRGFRQTRTAGDPLQQGGVVVITPAGEERYRYVSRTAGDHPSPRAVLRRCQS